MKLWAQTLIGLWRAIRQVLTVCLPPGLRACVCFHFLLATDEIQRKLSRFYLTVKPEKFSSGTMVYDVNDDC